ncbi:carotenoid biosynthesis protein [Anaeromyxobacter sp. Fw109-5]|uniref:carotenoid biosynthesis protein n=1 Tax=Anaeromyxobacter sp. (strain Fw109-5) TaxID=404589 RepID=UPI0000ED6E2C|nr:carotenoid biosynthesis protein [Anaeromyxobacter sp. Fw109-5]ABS28256.1 membrane protein-like protein [Anaeromyxobacter sp. Fw109-5]
MGLAEIAALLWGSVVHRPYVYAFLACFLAFAWYQLGGRRTLTFAAATWLLAFGAEYSSTRNGFPFGAYRYFDATRTRELWISNVPFFDSLSFVFLAWFSLALAAALLSPAEERARGSWPGLRRPAAPLLAGLLMTLLDVVIDPVALQGDEWFLGRIYEYPTRGFYFGVTAANFAGWFLVGAASAWVFQRCLAHVPWCRGPLRRVHPRLAWGVLGVYAGIFGFNLAVTIWIRDLPLAAASAAVIAVTLGASALRLRAPGSAGRVVVCAATRAEALACRRGIADSGALGVEVLRTGVGPARAGSALRVRLARAPRPRLVISSGFAGALSPDLAIGALVTARALHTLEGGRMAALELPPGLLRLAPAARPVEVVSAQGVLPALELSSGAADMESAALARAAVEAGVPFTVLRLVTDTPAAPLPPLARSLAAAFAARGLSRARHGLRAMAEAARRPVHTARFVRASVGWCRALRVAWRAEGLLAASSAAAREEGPRRAARPS